MVGILLNISLHLSKNRLINMQVQNMFTTKVLNGIEQTLKLHMPECS